MLLVKQNCSAAAAGLERLLPGSADKAVFESPKVAATGTRVYRGDALA
jgi:hypothetical protein